MRGWTIVCSVVLATLLAWGIALADDQQSDDGAKAKTTAGAGENAAAAEPEAPATCDELIAAGVEKTDAGKKMRGRGLRFRDKEMEQKGLALYEEGKQLLIRASNLSPECAEKVATLESKSADYKIKREEIDRSKLYF